MKSTLTKLFSVFILVLLCANTVHAQAINTVTTKLLNDATSEMNTVEGIAVQHGTQYLIMDMSFCNFSSIIDIDSDGDADHVGYFYSGDINSALNDLSEQFGSPYEVKNGLKKAYIWKDALKNTIVLATEKYEGSKQLWDDGFSLSYGNADYHALINQ